MLEYVIDWKFIHGFAVSNMSKQIWLSSSIYDVVIGTIKTGTELCVSYTVDKTYSYIYDISQINGYPEEWKTNFREYEKYNVKFKLHFKSNREFLKFKLKL